MKRLRFIALSLLSIASCSSPWGSLRERSSQCTAGRRDCDGDPANGCEVDTDSSREHCGACGRRAAVACVQGRPLDVSSIAGASATLCATVAGDSLGGLRCWGSNTHNQVTSDPPASARATPVDPMPGEANEVHAIAVGDGFGCAIRGPSRGLRCWGDGVRSLVGDARAAIESVVGARAIVAGGRHACVAVLNPANDRTVIQCFGDNDRGQLGGERSGTSPLVAVKSSSGSAIALERFAGVVAGSAHACAYNDSQILCWGANDEGQLGRAPRPGTASSAAASVVFSDAFDVVVHDVAAAGENTCAVVSSTRTPRDGGAAADVVDAASDAGELGDASPDAMDGSENADGGAGVSPCGADQSAQRRVLCWGSFARASMCAQRVVGAVRTTSGAPLENVERVFVGSRHACAIQQSGAVFCWGDDANGRFAGASARGPLVAVSVEALRSARSLAITGAANVLPASARTSDREGFCALFDEASTSARVRCWGPNSSGQLGDSTISSAQTVMPSDVRW